MSKLFILGAGFSKAVFPDEMPLMKDLADCIEAELDKFPDKFPKDSAYRKFMKDKDVEGLMTYLHQEIPWKPDYDIKYDEGLLLTLLDCIGEYITKCEEKAFQKPKQPPDWAKQFVRYLHEKELTVATFNYDTILERLSKELKPEKIEQSDSNIDIRGIYQIPISPLSLRASIGVALGDMGIVSLNTYRLLKLHGSINWFFARDMNFPGVPVYCVGFRENPNDIEYKINMAGLKPLIIPPVAEKAPFYGNQLVKILWAELKKAVDDADEIYCVGYSLPKSDYTTQIFFKTVINKVGRKVYIVNRESDSDVLIKNYEEALPDCELIKDYITDYKPVKKMVTDLK
ncbi:MAG: hypothetical protein AAB116_06875 [Candidatus Poribacteria bacterium]